MSTLQASIAHGLASIDEVSSRIETTFAQVGAQLGQGHAIFHDLNEALTDLSRELSCAQIEGASAALHKIAGELNGLTEALPAESALLDRLRRCVAEAGALLKQLLKHVAMITIIARSAKIESASLDGDRQSFAAFTQEAYELGKAVQRSMEVCARDQELLAAAVETAWERQTDFERRHRVQLGSSSAELTSAFADLDRQRSDSVQIAELAGASARTISEVVGRSIISLQAGDSTRQRLEHICDALRQIVDPAPTLVPAMVQDGPLAHVVVQLEAAQLGDTQQEFDAGIHEIVRALTTIHAEVTTLVDKGRALHGGREGDASSLLSRVRQSLDRASVLIGLCEDGGRSIDEALNVVEQTLTKFSDAIASLSNSVIDITLIGMNAGLKAGHLGTQGRAFVVIANEMKVTADQMTAGAARLSPLLSEIGQLADELREIRAHSDPSVLTSMEAVILQALHEVEGGNDRLDRLVRRLVDEGAEFDAVMSGAQRQMTALGTGVATLPAAAQRLQDAGGTLPATALAAEDGAAFDALFARYTMERERDVHRSLLQRFGLATKEPALASSDCDFELF